MISDDLYVNLTGNPLAAMYTERYNIVDLPKHRFKSFASMNAHSHGTKPDQLKALAVLLLGMATPSDQPYPKGIIVTKRFGSWWGFRAHLVKEAKRMNIIVYEFNPGSAKPYFKRAQGAPGT